MKLEKRSSGGEGDMPPVQEEKPAKSKPVVVYIMILFIAAFLLMALSFLMHQRSNTEALGQLQNSVSAMQEVQANQEKIIELQEELNDAQKALEAQEDEAKVSEEEAKEELLQAQLDTQALLSLYTLQQQYSAGDYASCMETIQKMEAAGYWTLLPEKSEENVTPPSVRFQQLKEAVEAHLAEQP